MLQEQYITLIQTLLDATKLNTLKWGKSNLNKFQYIIYPTNEQKILIDKYYAIQDGTQIPCVNMTIFNNPKEYIIDEIVLCHKADSNEDFNLLSELYNEAEQQFNKESNEKLNPILTHITESVQRSLTAHGS